MQQSLAHTEAGSRFDEHASEVSERGVTILSAKRGAALVLSVGLFGVASMALAQSGPTPQNSQTADQRVGQQTQSWLEMQTSGALASDAERDMAGPVAQRVYQRYLDSFTHPIPAQFPRESFSGDSES